MANKRGRAGGPVKKHVTDEVIEAELRDAIDQLRFLNRVAHRRIIRAMELLVMNHRQAFDYMSGDEILRQASYRQGMLYAFKMVAAMSQACLDENVDGAKSVSVMSSNRAQPEDDEEFDPYA